MWKFLEASKASVLYIYIDYILFLLDNIIDYFKCNTILTNFFTTFLQNLLLENYYWFA